MSSSWFLLRSGPGGFALNMAMDEALLEAIPRLGLPVLRFYGWSESAASFGYFQHYAEVERLTPLRPLVRRPTGGGIVPHEADWTYSLAFPAAHEWYSLSATGSYLRVHEWLQAAFARLKIDTQLAPVNVKAQHGECFVGCEKSDLLWSGRKIAGAAQRRRREGLLIQGSVQPTLLPLARTEWEQAMLDVARELHGVDWIEFQADELLQRRAQELAAQKYARADFNRRR
jgi:lipoate-protein ligase A